MGLLEKNRVIDQLRLVRGKNHGEKGAVLVRNFMYFPRVEKLGEEFRIYPCLGFTLSSDGKIVVEEGVLRDATVSCGIGVSGEYVCVVSDCLRDGGREIKNDKATR